MSCQTIIIVEQDKRLLVAKSNLIVHDNEPGHHLTNFIR
jgi:hypothetical protein